MRHLRRRGLKVVTPATQTALTTPARARAALPQAGLSSDDPQLAAQIDSLSTQICAYLDVPATLDGKTTIGVERVSEKIEIRRYTETFYLSRAPVVHVAGVPSIHLLMLDDDVLLNTELEILNDQALARFIDEDGRAREVAGEAIIEYTAGFSLPSNTTPIANASLMPAPIEDGMFALLKGMAAAARRDPTIRAESSDEVDSFTYFAEGANKVAWREAQQYLDPYRRIFR